VNILWRMLVCIGVVVGLCFDVSAQTRIGVIGKSTGEFFAQAYDGCKEFAATKADLTCLFDGPTDFQDPRQQVRSVQKMLDQKVDGLLIAAVDSKHLVDKVLKLAKLLDIPVMTFDSDLLPEHRDYRLAYVGTKNFDFGMALGNYAKRYKKDGLNEICIQSGSETTPNLNERVRGVRHALSGGGGYSRINGKNGWVELERCPFYAPGQNSRALMQLKYVLSETNAIFLAVAGFAQYSEDYISEMMPFQKDIRSGEKVVISADAGTIQLKALKQGLSTVNIGQQPFEMGRYSAQLLYQYIKMGKRPEREMNYLGYYYCKTGQRPLCTEAKTENHE
jgi:ribose transport system substrate-binding protein